MWYDSDTDWGQRNSKSLQGCSLKCENNSGNTKSIIMEGTNSHLKQLGLVCFLSHLSCCHVFQFWTFIPQIPGAVFCTFPASIQYEFPELAKHIHKTFHTVCNQWLPSCDRIAALFDIIHHIDLCWTGRQFRWLAEKWWSQDIWKHLTEDCGHSLHLFYIALKPTSQFKRKIYLIYFYICNLNKESKLADFLP